MNKNQTVPDPSSSNRFPAPWRILLATESRVDQKFAESLLSKHGHQVRLAGNGLEAVRECEAVEFDVVILDWLLPDLDGPNFVRAIRERDSATGRRVTILAMAEDDEDRRERCRQVGIDGLLSKPLRIEQLVACITNAKKRGRDATKLATTSDGELVDWDVALEAVGGRRDLLQELIQIFFVEYPQTLDAIRGAIDRGDAKGLQLSAHKLKGCLRYFGTTHASERAKELEDMGRSGQLDGAHHRLEALDLAMTRLLPSLRTAPN